MTPSDDFSSIPDDAWTLYQVDGPYRRYICHLDDQRSVIKTEMVEDDTLIRANQDELFESRMSRFGEGKVVARVPMNVFLDPATEIVEKLQEGDKDHIKWFLNSEQARPWRNFRGEV
ncbi:MAG: hypothetical protein KL863_07425 [Rhizobium sp.]|nr:hypothetical protein [Rhizobium sp.]